MGAGRDIKAVRRDGTEFPVEVCLAPIQTEGGVLVSATVLDITERKATEHALAQHQAELESANERLSQFAYVASLDLEEPLRKIASVSGLLDKAIASSDHASIVHCSEVMRSAALGARKLVDDLLTYARTIYGEQHLEILSLREEIQFTLAALSAPIVETKSEIHVDIPSTAFLADRSQLAYLLHNIISNAIKYRRPGRGAMVDVTATLEEGSNLCLAIADDGIGFEEEFAYTIFEPFKQRHGATVYPGSGIELAICKAIADRHGWGISVKSQPGKGTTFFFKIPVFMAIPPFGQE
jgi:light-regulated signal transduction histidine kinase (bacteriophytochrome)